MRKIRIFDTTLRDGDQTPGVSLQQQEKLEIARQLERLNVDVIEAGFPVTSDGDFQAVRAIAAAVTGPRIVALARVLPRDIDRAWEAVSSAVRPGIHTFVATSEVHMKHKLDKTPAEVLALTESAVKRAVGYGCEVEFSAEDATRSDPEFLRRVVSLAARSGAHVINIPDTVGYAAPREFYALIAMIRDHLDEQGLDPIISVHCHDDLGLAVANSLAAIEAGAGQVECTINGLGERAGNASLEETVMALSTRRDLFTAESGVDTRALWPTSRMVSVLTGVRIQPNKAVVGQNAFAHQSGIHQDGVIKHRSTYEIMSPDAVGVPSTRLVLGKTSGRHALAERLTELGVILDGESLDRTYIRFKQVADRKREISDRELLALVDHDRGSAAGRLSLIYYELSGGNRSRLGARVTLDSDGVQVTGEASGGGPVDAVYRAIDRALGVRSTLADYSLQAVTEGQDALGEVRVVVEVDGESRAGRGLSVDILEASARAYVDALNRFERLVESQRAAGDRG